MNSLFPMKKSYVFPEERFFNSFFGEDFIKDSRMMVDVRDLGESYLIEADLPGLKKEDISINYNNKILTIKASRNEEKKESTEEEEKKNKYIIKERKYFSFVRQFQIEDVQENGISAKFEDGVLKVDIKKKEKNTPPEGINISIE